MLEKLFNDFCDERRYLRNVSPLTIRSYRRSFIRFSKATGTSDIPIKAQLNEFVMKMREWGLSPVTCNISIRAMNAFLSWLLECGHIRERLKMKQLKVEKKIIKPYSDAELSRILSFRPNTFVQARLHTLVCTLIDTGCRIEEVLNIRTPELDFENLLITVRGKGNKKRVVPFSIELRKVLYKYVNRYGDSGFVFGNKHGDKADYRSLLKQWWRLCEKLGIEYRGFHSLRHNYGLNFIRQGGDISELRRLLGHSSITTTAMYVNLQTEDLKRAHARTSILTRLR